jgi:hypothetical protein
MDPLNNPDAPAGPQLLPEFRNSMTEKAAKLAEQASALFDQGTQARRLADAYVRLTVTLATVLLLTAIGQHFRIPAARTCLVVVAALLLLYSLSRILALPRLT